MKQWSYRTWVMLLSVLSWMRWFRTRLELNRRRQRELQVQQELRLRQEMRMALLEALTPLAEALHRLDSRQQETHLRLANLGQQLLQVQAENRQLEELLTEVLQGQQPTADQQIFPRIGPHLPTSTFLSSGS